MTTTVNPFALVEAAKPVADDDEEISEYCGATQKYWCDQCECWWNADDYLAVKVIYGGQISCHCGCNDYHHRDDGDDGGSRENAWFCSEGHFWHDSGDAPPIVWVCNVCEEECASELGCCSKEA